MTGTDPVVRLGTGDAGEVLTLQRAAYVTEAQAHGDLSMPPLTQTLEELRAELADSDRVPGQRSAGLIDGVHPRVIVHTIIVAGLPAGG